jgi:prepilin-type processing-associated H-X9-DG protein
MNMNLSPWNLPGQRGSGKLGDLRARFLSRKVPETTRAHIHPPRPLSCVAPHGGKGNVLYLDGHVTAFDGDYSGVGKGDPEHDDVRWLTGSASDAQAAHYP